MIAVSAAVNHNGTIVRRKRLTGARSVTQNDHQSADDISSTTALVVRPPSTSPYAIFLVALIRFASKRWQRDALFLRAYICLINLHHATQEEGQKGTHKRKLGCLSTL